MTTKRIPEQKVILCGEYGVGKSSLFRRFTSNSYTVATDRQSTLGLDHFSKPYNVAGKQLKVRLMCKLFRRNKFNGQILNKCSFNCGTQEEWKG